MSLAQKPSGAGAFGPAALELPPSRLSGLFSASVLAPVAVLTVLAAVLRFVDLGAQGFWFDESNTALLVHLSPGRMLGLIPHRESTPPFYYIVLWVWARIFGFGEAGLRSYSAVLGVATVPVLYFATARLVTRRAALFVAAFAACNPLLVWYSQEARSYSMLVFMSALTLLAFAYIVRGGDGSLIERPHGRALAAWAIACVAAIATHYYAVLIVAPEALWLLWAYGAERRVWIALGGLLAAGCALLPYAIEQNNSGRTAWISSVDLGRRLGQVVPQFVAGFGGPANSVLEPLGVALVIVAAVIAVASTGRWHAPELTGARAALAIALTGLVLNLLLVAAGIDDILSRNVLALWGAAAIGVGAALAWPRLGIAGVAAAGALCAIGIAGTIDVDTNQGLQRPDWRVVARALGRVPGGVPLKPQPGFTAYAPGASGGRLILIQHYRDLLPLSLYMPHLRFMRGPRERVTQIDVVAFSSPKTAGFCWWGSGCNLWPSLSQQTYRIPGFRQVSRQHVNQFTVVRLDSRAPQWVTRAEVGAALTRTRLRNDELLFQAPLPA